MNNVTVNRPICTNPVVIADISINQDAEGRHSLNDLHKAAGGQRRHEPKNWLNNQQTKELIEVIVNTGMSVFSPITSKRGCKGGTYVCKELVYAYATWVSAEFFLKVIRAYDALVTGDVEKAQQMAATSVDDRTPLRGIVNRIMGKYGMTYQAVYKLIHKEFGVKHIDELSPKQTAEAIEYLAGKVIEGEFIGKAALPASTFDFEMHAKNIKVARNHFNIFYQTWFSQIYPSLMATEWPRAGEMQERLKSVGSIAFILANHLDKEAEKYCKRIH